MRICILFPLVGALMSAATSSPPAESVAGAWVDSQCNVYDFVQSGTTLHIQSPKWRFDAPNTKMIYEGDLALAGSVGPTGFDADQRSTGVRLTGSLREKWIDGKLMVHGEDYDLPLCPRWSKLAIGCLTNAGAPPARLDVRTAGASNSPGGVVPAMIYVLDKRGKPTRSQAELPITVNGGSAGEQKLIVAKGAPFAATFIDVAKSGVNEIRAASIGVQPAAATVFGCAPSAPPSLSVVVREPRPIVGSTIPLVIAVFGPIGASGDTMLTPQWEPGSVGKLVDGTLVIPAGRCAAQAQLTSDEPGSSKLRISVPTVGILPAAVSVFWRRTMTPLLIGLSAVGGLIGVLLFKLFQARSTWRVRDIGVFIRGVLTGVVVYLMYFNLMILVHDPGGNVTAFVVGAAAGYAGKAALDRFAKRTLASGGPANNQSFRAKTA